MQLWANEMDLRPKKRLNKGVLNIDVSGKKQKWLNSCATSRASQELHFRYDWRRTKLEPLELGGEGHLLLAPGRILEAVQALRAVSPEPDVLLDKELLPQLEVQVQQRVQAGVEAQRQQEGAEAEQELREPGEDARGGDRADQRKASQLHCGVYAVRSGRLSGRRPYLRSGPGFVRRHLMSIVSFVNQSVEITFLDTSL